MNVSLTHSTRDEMSLLNLQFEHPAETAAQWNDLLLLLFSFCSTHISNSLDCADQTERSTVYWPINITWVQWTQDL